MPHVGLDSEQTDRRAFLYRLFVEHLSNYGVNAKFRIEVCESLATERLSYNTKLKLLFAIIYLPNTIALHRLAVVDNCERILGI